MLKRLPAHLRLLAVLGLSLPLLNVAPALAQTTAKETPAAGAPVSDTPSTTTATYGDWILRCVTLTPQSDAKANGKTATPSGQNCEIVQTIQVKGQTKPIAQVAFGHLPGQSDLIMTAVLPVNVLLPGMVHVSSNAKTGNEEKGGLDLAWTRCVPVACFADAKPTQPVLDVMRAEMSGQLTFKDATGRTIALPLSWKGFTNALTALK